MGLRGDLRELALSDLIEMTSLGGKTGLLLLSGPDGGLAGQLAFREGRLVGASCGNLTAEKAFYTLLDLQEGTFDFDPQAQLDEETCNLATESLLMEGMRRIDEIQHLRRQLPAPAVLRAQLRDVAVDDPAEARVLGYLGPGQRTIGDVVDGMLVAGDYDEYEALRAIGRLRDRGVVGVQVPLGPDGEPVTAGGPPQPELER